MLSMLKGLYAFANSELANQDLLKAIESEMQKEKTRFAMECAFSTARSRKYFQGESFTIDIETVKTPVELALGGATAVELIIQTAGRIDAKNRHISVLDKRARFTPVVAVVSDNDVKKIIGFDFKKEQAEDMNSFSLQTHSYITSENKQKLLIVVMNQLENNITNLNIYDMTIIVVDSKKDFTVNHYVDTTRQELQSMMKKLSCDEAMESKAAHIEVLSSELYHNMRVR